MIPEHIADSCGCLRGQRLRAEMPMKFDLTGARKEGSNDAWGEGKEMVPEPPLCENLLNWDSDQIIPILLIATQLICVRIIVHVVVEGARGR